jgi:hypothetical protein
MEPSGKCQELDIEDGGIAVGTLKLPSTMTEADIQAAVAIIEEWEASHRSACELIALLYPVLACSALRPQA